MLQSYSKQQISLQTLLYVQLVAQLHAISSSFVLWSFCKLCYVIMDIQ